MPGILPMKVIKIGSHAQARVAQACDRCRSKKIRCDGIRPTCTQCINVGFECKTSDKLSRRAFPRGYTESLEERVRSLEAEVRELKVLLDEKDEKIDMLSRMHSNSPRNTHSPKRLSGSSPVAVSLASSEDLPPDPDDLFKIVQSPLLFSDENSESLFMGTSGGRLLIDAFKSRVQQKGHAAVQINTDTFFQTEPTPSNSLIKPDVVCWKVPARLLSDQLVNIFFQEWAPLFPVIHRPTFLSLYDEYVSRPEAVEDKKSLAQLHLVFGIAALSSDAHSTPDVQSFEAQWHAALECFVMDSSLSTLQCIVLAQIYCLQKADYARLLKYKGLAVSLAHRLGLHQSQKRFAFGALTSETRKKVFWTLYTIDCFSAAQLGLPQLIKDEDIYCDYPVDADDEYVTEKGFLPTVPGEFTKLSSALALFRASRVLAKVLKENYPAAPSHEISFKKLTALSDELDDWSFALAPHLRLQFIQDKPSTNVISSRSPLLSLAYQYIKSLIYRPAVCVISVVGDKASAASVALASCSKHVVQIVELLEERHLSFSFCLNKNELLVLSGFGLLFQGLELDRNGALMKDNSRLVSRVADLLNRTPCPASAEFRRICSSFTLDSTLAMRKSPVLSRHESVPNLSFVKQKLQNTQTQVKAIAAKSSPAVTKACSKPANDRRATVPVLKPLDHRLNQSQTAINSINSIYSEPAIPCSEPALSPHLPRSSLSPVNKARASAPVTYTNLDYLSFSTDTAPSTYPHVDTTNSKTPISPTDWERLLSSLDNGQTNIYDSIYGGQQASDTSAEFSPLIDHAATAPNLVWSLASPDPSPWPLSADTTAFAPPAQSVLSFSDESLTSGEEFAELASGPDEETYGGIVIPELSPYAVDAMGLVGLDGNFGL